MMPRNILYAACAAIRSFFFRRLAPFCHTRSGGATGALPGSRVRIDFSMTARRMKKVYQLGRVM
ncbi:MAG TPA: hypothetical protein DD766_00855 [Desulfovibrio sp.]|nr:hypothetical protein [Desulfovibrio sp.]